MIKVSLHVIGLIFTYILTNKVTTSAKSSISGQKYEWGQNQPQLCELVILIGSAKSNSAVYHIF